MRGPNGLAFSGSSVLTKVARLNAEAIRINPKLITEATGADGPATPAFEVISARPILRPDLIKVADRILLPGRLGVPRDQIKVPIAPTDAPDDGSLYEDPASPERRYYLPRYRVAQDDERYRIALLEVDPGWRLEIDLEKFLAPELAEEGWEAGELPHDVAVVLRYELPVASSESGAQIEAVATVSTTDDGLTRASFPAAQPDELVLALSDVDRKTKLVVQRSFRAAVPFGAGSDRTTLTADPILRDRIGERAGGFFPRIPREAWQRAAKLNSGPDPSSWGAGRLDVFGQGPDAAVWHKWYENGWSSWESLGGIKTSDPAAVSWGPGRIDIFARGQDNALWHRWYDGGWSEWESLGGGLSSGPDVASWGPGHLDVCARGLDNALWHISYEGGWSAWESLGGGITSDPAAVSWGPGRVDSFARGEDNALWHRWFEGGWSDWESLGGGLSSGPDVCSWGPGRLDVFARGLDNALWHRWFERGWSDWESLGGALNSDPGAVSWGPGRIDVFARSNADALSHLWYEGGWSAWEDLDAPGTAEPAGPLYQERGHLLEDIADPELFYFSKDRHGYIYGGATGGSAEDHGLQPVRAQWEGRNYLYLQRRSEPHVFFYLPDAFKLARDPDPPHAPTLRVSIRPGSLEEVEVSLDYVAVPSVDPDRLAGTADQLRATIRTALPEGVQAPLYEPLPVSRNDITFALTLPRAGGGSSAREVQAEASIDMRSAITGSISRPLSGFQSIFDSLLSSSDTAVVFQGTIEVSGLGGESTEVIPFTGRLDDLVGPPLKAEHSAEDGAVEAILTNSIESPVRVRSLAAAIEYPEGPVEATIKRGARPFPVELEPGEHLELALKPAGEGASLKVTGEVGTKMWQALERDGQPVAEPKLRLGAEGDAVRVLQQALANLGFHEGAIDGIFGPQTEAAVRAYQEASAASSARGAPTGVRIDQSEVEVMPDKERIWEAILDRSVDPAYDRAITVVATFVFQSQADAADPIQAVLVDFERGDAVELTEGEGEAEAKVRVPITDIILRHEQESAYRYRLQVARRSGRIDRDDDWREDDIDRLLLSVDELPGPGATDEGEEPTGGDEPA